MLNHHLFENIKKAHSRVLLVTKYWDKIQTQEIIKQSKQLYPEIVFAYGENRIEAIREKNIKRQDLHFIGNIQSQKIPEIVKTCSVIHSLSSLKHASKIENQ